MKSTYKYTNAVNQIAEGALPTEADIDAMNPSELAKFLSENGVNLPSLQSEIASSKAKFEGKLNLARARKKRLGSLECEKVVDLSSMPQEQLEADLIKIYGSIENIPLAARNFRNLSRKEWESLYRDLILNKYR